MLPLKAQWGQGRRQQEMRLQSKLMKLLWFDRGKENEQRHV